jgi:hypothetical protein
MLWAIASRRKNYRNARHSNGKIRELIHADEKRKIEHFIYRAENTGLEIAHRFLTSAEDTFNLLAVQPMLGMAAGAAGMGKNRRSTGPETG